MSYEQPQQTIEEAKAIAKYWLEHYCPPGLKNKEGVMDLASGNLLGDWCVTNYGKLSFKGLNEGVKALTDQLNWYNPPTVIEKIVEIERKKTPAEIRAERYQKLNLAGVRGDEGVKTELDRGDREQEESNRRRETKEARVKEQKAAKTAVEALVNSYCVMLPNGHINHTVTNGRCEQLRSKMNAAGNDYVKALADIQQMLTFFERQDSQRR